MELLSDFFTDKMLKYQVINECDRKIYAYGIRALLQKIIFTSSLFFAAFMIHELYYTVVFYFSYIEVRGTYGSFHSKNRITCFGWTAFICLLAYYMKNLVLVSMPIPMLTILISFVFLSLNYIKYVRNQAYMQEARGCFLYVAFYAFHALGLKTISYGILMAFFCTVLLECIQCVEAVLWKKD